jgi:hypothetical protein
MMHDPVIGATNSNRAGEVAEEEARAEEVARPAAEKCVILWKNLEFRREFS